MRSLKVSRILSKNFLVLASLQMLPRVLRPLRTNTGAAIFVSTVISFTTSIGRRVLSNLAWHCDAVENGEEGRKGEEAEAK